MSTIVATMLLLTITVILFAAIFFFINDFPKPGPQPQTEFDSTLSYSGTTLSSISILHLSGSTLNGASTAQAAIYLASQKHPTAFPSAFTLAAGLSGATAWSFGETWSLSLTTYGITAPDNLTVTIISAGQLDYQATIPVATKGFAPYFGSVQTSPSGTLPASTAYTLTASVFFSTSSGDSVKINTTEFPTGGGTFSMTSGGNGVYTYSGTSPNPSSTTTYYLFLTATDGNGAQTVLAVPVTVT